MGEGAGLHDVPVALLRAVLTLELVAAINLSRLAGRQAVWVSYWGAKISFYLSEPIGVEVHSDIGAKGLVHRAQLLGDKPGAVWAEALVVDIQAQLGRAERGQTEEELEGAGTGHRQGRDLGLTGSVFCVLSSLFSAITDKLD